MFEQREAEGGDHGAGDLGLDAENVVHGEFIDISPQAGVVGSANELGCDADPLDRPLAAGPAHRAGEQVLHPKLAPDLPGALSRPAILEGARPRDNG